MFTKRDNLSLGCAGLGAGSNAGTFKTTNGFSYQIDGLCYFKGPTDNIAFTPMTRTPAITAPALGASAITVLFVSVDKAGNFFYEPPPHVGQYGQGLIGKTGAGYTGGAVEWPQETKGMAVIGGIKIETNGSGAFTAGTTGLGAANQTVTFYNVGADYGVALPF